MKLSTLIYNLVFHIKIFAAILMVLLCWTILPAQATTDPNVGARIFQQGFVTEALPVTAQVGARDVAVEGAVVACANCHGISASGAPDAWGRPPSLKWGVLMRKFGVLRADGTLRPAYDESSFARAITHGVDAGGRRLDSAMPRYSLGANEISALMAYLKFIDEREESFHATENITFATFTVSDSSEASGNVLTGLHECTAATPHLYGRSIKLRVFDLEQEPDFVRLAEQISAMPEVVSIVAPIIAGSEDAIFKAFAKSTVPVIGPIGLITAENANAPIFFLSGGLREEILILSRRLAQSVSKNGRLLIVYGSDDVGRLLANDATNAARNIEPNLKVELIHLPLAQSPENSGGLVERKPINTGDALLLLTPLSMFARIEYLPLKDLNKVTVGIPSLYLGDKHSLDIRIFGAAQWVSYPWLAGQPGEGSLYSRWAKMSCEIAIEALRRMGQSASRQNMVRAVESIDRYAQHHIDPPLRFGPTRHIGAPGAFIAPLSKKTGRPEFDKSLWLEADHDVVSDNLSK